jgi:hypothetical protein
MNNPLTPKFTGRKRHRVHTYGFLKKKTVLVLQYEMYGFVPELCGGMVDGDYKNWWVDARPEWELLVE